MSEALNSSAGTEAVMSTLVAAMRTNRDGAMQNWSRTCDLYARYFSALAKAQGPGGLLAANADLLTGGMEMLGEHGAARARLD